MFEDLRKVKSWEIIDFDGPVFDTYKIPNATKYFDAGETLPFDRARRLVSAEAIQHITESVRNGIYPIFNTSALGTSFRGNPLPFTEKWGDPNSNEYLQYLREFQKKGFEAKRKQFESLRSMLPPDVRNELSVENNLIVTQPSAGEDKVGTTYAFFNKRNIPINESLKSRTTIYDDEQGNLDKFAAAGFTNTRLTLPANFTKMPFAKVRGRPWDENYRGRMYGKYIPSYAQTPEWGNHPTLLVSPSTVQSLDYAHRNNDMHQFKMQVQGIPGSNIDESSNAATRFGVLAEDRFNAALSNTDNIDDFYRIVAGTDFKIEENGVNRAISPNWSKSQIDAVLPYLSQSYQQYILGHKMDVDGQSILLSGKPDYLKVLPPSRRHPNGAVLITDAKTSGIFGNPKTDEELRNTYHPQAASYSVMAAAAFPNADIYMGYMHMPVDGNQLSDIKWVPNRVDKYGNALPEDIEHNKTYLNSKLRSFFRGLKHHGLFNNYVSNYAGRKLVDKIGKPTVSNYIDEESREGAQQYIDAANDIITPDNPNAALAIESPDEAISKNKAIGISGELPPLDAAHVYELNGVKQTVSRLADTINNFARIRAGKNVNRDVLRSMYNEDPTGESAAWYIAEQIGEKEGPYETVNKRSNDRRLKKSVATVIDNFQAEEAAKFEAKREKELKRQEKRNREIALHTSERNATISARRRFNVASRIADLDTMPLFQFQRDRLAKQYASIDTSSNVDDPTDAQRFASALRDVNRALQAAERNTKAWTNILNVVAHTVNQPWYNGERLADVTASGLSQMNSSASGIIPRRLRSITGHTTAIGQDLAHLWWDENYNLKYKVVETARPVYTSVASGIGAVVGGVIGGPLGAIAGGAAGVGLAGIPSFISQVKGNIAERNLKTSIGHADIALNIMSIFGELAKNILTLPLKVFTNAVKVAAGSLTASAVLIDRFMKQGLDSLQSLGNPIKGLSGVRGYSQYQGLGFADTFLGHQKGTTNAGLEAFGAAQSRLYSLGELDDNRVISSAILGVFNEVYGNHEDPEAAHARMVNKLARDYANGDKRQRRNILAMSRDIDASLPQTLQVMNDMGITDFNELKQPPGVYWRGIGDGERGAMRWTNAQWQATKEMLGVTKMRIASRIWNRVGRNFYNGVSHTGDLISQGHWKDWESLDDEGNVVKHKGAINTALGTFRELIDNIKEWWNTSELSSAIVEFIQEAVDNVKEWLKNLDISGLATTVGAKISELFGNINWQSLMEGPLGGVVGVIENIGKMLINTFINAFNTLRGMRFDMKEFILSGGKKGLDFGAGSLTNEALIEHLSYGWTPKTWTDDAGVVHHSLQEVVTQTDLGTELAVALQGKTSTLGLMRRFGNKAMETVGTDQSGRAIPLGEYVAMLIASTKEGKGKWDPRLEWTALWQGTTGTQWGDTTWLGTKLSDFTGSTPGTRQVNEYASNAVEQVVKKVGDAKDAGRIIVDAARDSTMKLKIYVVDKNGVEREAQVSDIKGPDGSREAVLRLFSEQLVKG